MSEFRREFDSPTPHSMARRSSMFRPQAHRQSEVPKSPVLWGADCAHCPLRGCQMVWGDGPRDAQMAFVDESPGKEELSAGIPLCGRNGELFEAILDKHGVKRMDTWVDQAVMCFPPGGDLKAYLQKFKKEARDAGAAAAPSPVECCRPRLYRALGIRRCRDCGKYEQGVNACSCSTPRPNDYGGKGGLKKAPLVMVALGNLAMESVLGVTGITARRGYVFDMRARREERAEKAAKGKK